MKSKLEFHPIASIFPLMQQEDLDKLAVDIQVNGLREPIMLYQKKVLDGRNRLLACEKVSVQPVFDDYQGDSPLAYVVSLNLKRRHLTPSQRAVCAVASLAVLEIEAEKRLHLSKGRGEKGPVKIPEVLGDARDQAGKLFGVSGKYVDQAKHIQDKDAKAFEAVKAGTMTLRKAMAAITKRERAANRPKPVPGKFRTIVIDPPWPVDKIERETVPTQGPVLNYKTMTVDAIKGMKLPADPNGCHLYLWTTQKYLPTAFEIVQGWGFKYVFTMVWHKNGGFQPFGLPQYNCEFVLFGRTKGLEFTDIKAFPCCFDGKRGAHSEKPQEFYDLVRRVSPSPHIDIFGRKNREGWQVWGDEITNAAK